MSVLLDEHPYRNHSLWGEGVLLQTLTLIPKITKENK